MRLVLRPHPTTPCAALDAIEVEVARAGSRLSLRYVATGDPKALVLPAPDAPIRTEGLWRTTCFEAFVRPDAEEGYAEFNLAPSRRWAAYRFSGYREGMAAIEPLAAPAVIFEATPTSLTLDAMIETGLTADAAWRVGLSAVIEEGSGAISYWALVHPPGKPDFHHPDCFALQLPETGRP